jgi:putative ABC transport system permease protein
MLVLKNIVKDYTLGQKDSVRALKDISVAFEKSGFVSILGQSGCGKTTLLNIIGGLDKYTSGDLLIDGISTKDYKGKDWDLYRNNKIGFVFQNYNLIPHLSILENVMIPLSLNGESAASRKEKAIKALEQVGLKENFKKKPNQLSGGQAQRVAIARALVNDPEIILADEPTGALDSQTSVLVMEILKEISKTKLVIMVTHNQVLANEYSTRIITMKDGEITGDSNNPNIVNESSDNKIEGKTSMGFLTAIKMALKNIFTKKGRVAMISVASSFGVIGVGLVLALSNGFEGYIKRVEESTANNAPITISNRSINYKINENLEEYEQFPTNEEVNVYDASQNQLLVETIHTNKLDKQFLKYIDDIDKNEKYKGTLSSCLVNKILQSLLSA